MQDTVITSSVYSYREADWLSSNCITSFNCTAHIVNAIRTAKRERISQPDSQCSVNGKWTRQMFGNAGLVVSHELLDSFTMYYKQVFEYKLKICLLLPPKVCDTECSVIHQKSPGCLTDLKRNFCKYCVVS